MPATLATTDVTPLSVLVGNGIRCILHLFKSPAQGDIDTRKNLLYGYKVDGFQKSESTVDQTEISAEGIIAAFASSKVTGGDVTLNFSYDPTFGAMPIVEPVAGITYAPQAMLWFGFLDPDSLIGDDPEPALIPFGEFPVNISGFGEINIQKGQPGTSSLKFKITGEGEKTLTSQINDGNNILYKGSLQ